MIKLIYIDVETTGVDPVKNGIHQISGCIEIDYELKESFNFKVQPRPGCILDQYALDLGKVTAEQINAYPPMKEVFSKLIDILNKYVNVYDKKDKAFFVGFNSHFDSDFMRQFFADCGNKFFGAYFYSGTIDVMCLALNFLKWIRFSMINFKLPTVAEKFGIKIDQNTLHDASYDVVLTREIYHKIEKETIKKFKELQKNEKV